MRYILDTNICIYIMNRKPASVARKFAKCRRGDVVISTISLAELEYGVRCSSSITQQQNRSALDALVKVIAPVAFSKEAAKVYADIRASAPERKKDALDKLIASHARSLGLILVTNNMSDFQMYPGIKLENWVEAST